MKDIELRNCKFHFLKISKTTNYLFLFVPVKLLGLGLRESLLFGSFHTLMGWASQLMDFHFF
jgi:hypothetical protein